MDDMSKVLALGYCFIVVFRFFQMLIQDRWIIALMIYSVPPVFIYITGALLHIEKVNFFKFYIAWIPLLFSDKVKDWVNK